MRIAKIIFNDNSELKLNVESSLFGIRVSDTSEFSNDELSKSQHFMFPLSASEYPLLKLDIHTHAGILPSIIELLENYPYFYLEENKNVVYSSKSVLRIELID